MHSLGAKNYENIVQVNLRETFDIAESFSITLFGKRNPIPVDKVPRRIRTRFGNGVVEVVKSLSLNGVRYYIKQHTGLRSRYTDSMLLLL